MPEPATTSSFPPVAVLNVQIPAPMFAFWLLPTVSRMYGPPIGSEPPKSW